MYDITLTAEIVLQVTGEEEPMYHARVMVASKVRKNDLPVKSGDTVGIIRTTSCPKGKWLARDANNKCEFRSCCFVFLSRFTVFSVTALSWLLQTGTFQ